VLPRALAYLTHLIFQNAAEIVEASLDEFYLFLRDLLTLLGLTCQLRLHLK